MCYYQAPQHSAKHTLDASKQNTHTHIILSIVLRHIIYPSICASSVSQLKISEWLPECPVFVVVAERTNTNIITINNKNTYTFICAADLLSCSFWRVTPVHRMFWNHLRQQQSYNVVVYYGEQALFFRCWCVNLAAELSFAARHRWILIIYRRHQRRGRRSATSSSQKNMCHIHNSIIIKLPFVPFDCVLNVPQRNNFVCIMYIYCTFRYTVMHIETNKQITNNKIHTKTQSRGFNAYAGIFSMRLQRINSAVPHQIALLLHILPCGDVSARSLWDARVGRTRKSTSLVRQQRQRRRLRSTPKNMRAQGYF